MELTPKIPRQSQPRLLQLPHKKELLHHHFLAEKDGEKKNNTKNFSLTFLSRGKQDLREVYNPLSM